MAEREKIWIRGEFVIRGAEPGFVKTDAYDGDEFITICWQSGVENIHRQQFHEIRRPTEAESARLNESGAMPPLKALKSIEALDNIAALLSERSQTIKDPREKSRVDELTKRGFSDQFQCDWDRRHANMLVLLALQPEAVGWLFKVRERLHAPIHTLFHRAN